jgi:hypothetical protein
MDSTACSWGGKTTTSMPHVPCLHRVAEATDRERVPFTIDGAPATALAGDTVLTAVLTQGGQLRRNEFSGLPRAGFCMMGACQDCWIATESEGERLRACSTFIAPGMALSPEGTAHDDDERTRPVIVGAGPAGIRAAQALVAHGLRPVVIDEASAPVARSTAASPRAWRSAQAHALRLRVEARRRRARRPSMR